MNSYFSKPRGLCSGSYEVPTRIEPQQTGAGLAVMGQCPTCGQQFLVVNHEVEAFSATVLVDGMRISGGDLMSRHTIYAVEAHKAPAVRLPKRSR